MKRSVKGIIASSKSHRELHPDLRGVLSRDIRRMRKLIGHDGAIRWHNLPRVPEHERRLRAALAAGGM